ncbi:MAG: substrate-binding domain-containing protein [Bacteroidia bacterium]|nr:substrate-binding domain-containing protein [Bacteroidia bacterium]
MSYKAILCSIIASAMLISCNNQPKGEELDTPTSGTIPFVIDEVIQPLAEELTISFVARYPKAHLIPRVAPEKDAALMLINDSARNGLLTRKLTKEEVAFFESKKFGLEQVLLASDAVAFVVNRNNTDSVFTKDQLRRILLGQDTLWSQISPGSTLGRIRVVFDNPGSSNIRYLSDTLLGKQPLSKSCFAVQTNQAVIEYVNEHPEAIGVVGLNWIGDKDSEADMSRRKMIVLAAVGDSLNTATTPHQSALALHTYPFCREVWFVKIGKRPGLGTGFASFAYSEVGQLIVQKAGLLAAKPAERRIELKVN